MQTKTASTVRILRNNGWTSNEIERWLRLSEAEVESIAEPINNEDYNVKHTCEHERRRRVCVDTYMQQMMERRR